MTFCLFHHRDASLVDHYFHRDLNSLYIREFIRVNVHIVAKVNNLHFLCQKLQILMRFSFHSLSAGFCALVSVEIAYKKTYRVREINLIYSETIYDSMETMIFFYLNSEKPFKCPMDECRTLSVAFSQLPHLKKHMLSIHGKVCILRLSTNNFFMNLSSL